MFEFDVPVAVVVVMVEFCVWFAFCCLRSAFSGRFLKKESFFKKFYIFTRNLGKLLK